jgi:flavodoxin I
MEKMQMRAKAVIIYASCSGHTEAVCEAVASGMNKSLPTELKRVELADATKLTEHDLIILASPTYNVGKLQEYFEPFYKEFIKQKYPKKAFVVIGLGDSKNYDIFCGAAAILEEAIKIVEGELVYETLKIDGPPYAQLDELCGWGEELAVKFNSLASNPLS